MTITDEENYDEDEQLLISVIADNGGSPPLYKMPAFSMVGQV